MNQDNVIYLDDSNSLYLEKPLPIHIPTKFRNNNNPIFKFGIENKKGEKIEIYIDKNNINNIIPDKVSNDKPQIITNTIHPDDRCFFKSYNYIRDNLLPQILYAQPIKLFFKTSYDVKDDSIVLSFDIYYKIGLFKHQLIRHNPIKFIFTKDQYYTARAIIDCIV